MWRKGNLSILLEEINWKKPIIENSVEAPLKMKVELSYDLAMPFLDIYQEKP